jgi:spectinomycin phosphotransferase
LAGSGALLSSGVFTRHDDLADDRVRHALAEGWGLRARWVEYAPVGFGSYHWRAEAGDRRWFVTADELAPTSPSTDARRGEALRRLSAALTVARSLRDSGMMFVVAPERTTAGGVVHVVDDRFAFAVHPYVEGEHHAWGPYPTRGARLAVLDLLAVVHAAADVRGVALTDDGALAHRHELVAGLDDLGGRWDTGPFGEPARRLVARRAATIRRALARYDDLVTTVLGRPERLVLTHGEPHRANTITTAGGPVLIDWDTALLAPPERDLWALADEDPRTVADYETRIGVTPQADALDLYHLRWDLTEIAIFTGLFRRPHRETEDSVTAWDALVRYLDPDRWTSTG